MQSWKAAVVPSLPPDASLGPVRVHDTRSDGLLPVGPATGTARLYVCGITPYDATHLGHANTYVTFDLLQRQWRDVGLNVNYVQNVTDVDDPLLERATATGVDWRDLASGEIDLFRADMTALRVLPPADYVGAVESIPWVIELLQRMPEGLVVPVDDPEYPDLYFRCSAVEEFGELASADREVLLRLFGERGGDPERPGKTDPFDCLVWRLARPGEPAWPSPWGDGRPGWHVECAAIAGRLLGPDFDVQGGGSDLVFPHHEMGAAEARAATGRPLAQAFVHAGMVGLDGEKMSKSKGNLVKVSQLRADGVDPMAVRLVLLGQHYRTDWSFTAALLAEATERLDRWRRAVLADEVASVASVVAAMRRALRTDLDAPAAVAAVDAWAHDTLAGPGSARRADDPADARELANAVDALLGVDLGPR